MEQTLSTPLNDAKMHTPRWQLVVIAILAIAVIGLSTALWFSRPPAEGSREVTFARDMIAHHQQAVEMALVVFKRDVPEDLRVLTEDIMMTQQGQVGIMSGWLNAWGRTFGGEEQPMGGLAMGMAMGMASPEQVKALGTMPLPEAEIQFLQLMIRHHQGGVDMAKEIIGKTSQPEVERLAQSIIDSQESEIKYMTDLLAKRGAQPLPPLPPMQMDHH